MDIFDPEKELPHKIQKPLSHPDLRLIVDRNQRSIFKQKAGRSPRKEKVENLLHPMEFIALYLWLDGKGMIEEKDRL